MLIAAVKAVVAQSPAIKDPRKGLVPDVTNTREVSVHIAKAVIMQEIEKELATEKNVPKMSESLKEQV